MKLGWGPLLFLCLAWALPPQALPGGDPLSVGIFPRRDYAATLRMFKPLAEYLGHRLGRTVRLETAYDFRGFWDGVIARRYHLVHYNQYHYVKSRASHGYRVVLKNQERGEARLRSVILVRRDSGIRSLGELRGKKVIFGGGRDAMVSHIAAMHLLQAAGLNGGDFLSEFALNPLRASLALYYHQGAAAAVGHVVPDLPLVSGQIDSEELMEIASSEPLAHLPWALRDDVTKELGQSIVQALVDLGQTAKGRDILAAAGLDRLVPAEDSEYDPHRRIIRAVLGESY